MKEPKLQKVLGDLIDTKIGFILNDYKYLKGVLLDVKQDHIVVDVNKKIFYFALQYIQTISSNTKDYPVSTKVVHYVDKNYLIDVLTSFRNNWVSINSLSGQEVLGVLSRISDDHVTVINNSELLYIPKSYISNINSNISEEEIILINKLEQRALQDSQIEEHMTSEHTLKTKEIELITSTEAPIFEIPTEKETEDENVAIVEPELHTNPRLEIYKVLIKLLKYNLVDADLDDKSRVQTDTLAVETKDYQVEEQVLVEHSQPTNKTKSIKNLEAPIIEGSVREEMETENATQVNADISSQLDRPDLLEPVKEYSLEANRIGVLESNNRFGEKERVLVNELKPKHKKKKMLLATSGPMNDDQHPNVEKKAETTEIDTSHLPGVHINPREEKRMLEKQHFALMKHAEKNCDHMAEKDIKVSEEIQYLALLKHTARMYREFKI